MFVNLRHSYIGLIKQVKLGFSWTTLFFGIFVPLLRGDIKWALIMGVSALLTFGLSWLVYPFLYNKLYVKDLIEKGYVPADETSKNALAEKGIYFAP